MSELSGKINHSIFEEYIQQKCGSVRPEILIGPGFGVDVAVVDLHNGNAMALTSDPLSIIPSLGLEESAWLLVHLIANDMATTGFAPMYGQFVLNLPSYLSKANFETYWEYIHHFSEKINLSITGGHTGFIEDQNSTIAGGGTVITIAPKNKILTSKNAKVGDAILVTKTSALSSSAILAMSFPKTVINKLGTETYLNACETFYKTSSLKDALIAFNDGKSSVTAMHDVTEGGILGAIYELAYASGNGAYIYEEKLPLGETQLAICNLFSIDPYYSIGAGSMIITCKKEKVEEIIARLSLEDIPCTEVGELTNLTNGIQLITENKMSEIQYLDTDPYWKAFFNAYKLGWK